MDLMEHKRSIIKTLIDMLKQSSGDEMDRDMHPSGLKVEAEKVEPPHGMEKEPPKMAMGGEVSPNVDPEAMQAPESPVLEQEHDEEEPEDIPAIAALRRRR